MQVSLRSACARTLALVRPPARAARRAGAAAPRAANGESTAGPLGGFVDLISKAVQNSPLAAGKQALAESQAAGYDPALAAAKVDALVAENAVVMFSFSGCPFCKSAKKLLDAEGAKYTAVELDQMGLEGKALRAELGRRTGRTSQPNIFIAGRGIGGCNDGTPGLVPLQKSGELRPLLQAAGAL